MIWLALAATLTSAQGTLDYRLAVSGPAGTSVTVTAQPPAGWTAAFCSARLCAVGHVPVRIAATGTSFVDLHLYPTAHPAHGTVFVGAGNKTLHLRV